MGSPSFKWLGTAGFRIEVDGSVILIDPFLSRSERATPVQDLTAADMADADFIFLSHGHFDHLADVPEIATLSRAQVYCSEVAGRTLISKGTAAYRVTVLHQGDRVDEGIFSVGVETCRHIRFDYRLILRTAPGVLREASSVLPLTRGMPSGPVMVCSFRFGDLAITHLGSLGLKPDDLPEKDIPRPDILFLPLQGHTDICRRAAELAAAMRPRAVVPEHHDDFFPPVSQTVRLEPFEHMVRRLAPGIGYYEPTMNESFTAEEVLETSSS